MASGVISSPMEVSDIVRMVEAVEATHAEAERQEKNEALERSYNPFGEALGGGLK